MTAAELEQLLSALDVPQKDGAYTVAEGKSLTLHVAHQGAALAVSRVERLQIDKWLVVAHTPKSAVAFHVQEIFAVAREGTATEGRRPAGFGV